MDSAHRAIVQFKSPHSFCTYPLPTPLHKSRGVVAVCLSAHLHQSVSRLSPFSVCTSVCRIPRLGAGISFTTIEVVYPMPTVLATNKVLHILTASYSHMVIAIVIPYDYLPHRVLLSLMQNRGRAERKHRKEILLKISYVLGISLLSCLPALCNCL